MKTSPIIEELYIKQREDYLNNKKKNGALKEGEIHLDGTTYIYMLIETGALDEEDLINIPTSFLESSFILTPITKEDIDYEDAIKDDQQPPITNKKEAFAAIRDMAKLNDLKIFDDDKDENSKVPFTSKNTTSNNRNVSKRSEIYFGKDKSNHHLTIRKK